MKAIKNTISDVVLKPKLKQWIGENIFEHIVELVASWILLKEGTIVQITSETFVSCDQWLNLHYLWGPGQLSSGTNLSSWAPILWNSSQNPYFYSVLPKGCILTCLLFFLQCKPLTCFILLFTRMTCECGLLLAFQRGMFLRLPVLYELCMRFRGHRWKDFVWNC